MPRQYMAVRVTGNPNEILDLVRHRVRGFGCGHVVQVVHYEKRAKGEYYVFLGFETPHLGWVPEDVGNIFDTPRFAGQRLGPLNLDQIRGMLDPTEFDTSGSDRIPYLSRWVEEPGDLFDLIASDTGGVTPVDPEQTARFDRLLAWLSAVGEGRWESFVRACQTLGVIPDVQTARVVFRRLSLLGHVECSVDARTWTVCPPVIVRYASQPTRGFLSGLRTFRWGQQLPGSFAGDTCSQPGGQGPSRVAIEIPASPPQGPLGRPVCCRDEPLACTLAEMLPDLNGWEQSLQPVVGLTNPQRAERWEGNAYVEAPEFYFRAGRYHGRSGLYRITRGNDRRQTQLTFYFDAEHQHLVRGDWYGLRFLAMLKERKPGDALWQRANGSGVLILANRRRWPMVYERTLVLASGLLPEHNPRTDLLQYHDIPLTAAKALTSRLGVALEILE